MGRQRFFWLFLSIACASLIAASIRIVFSPHQLESLLHTKLQQDLVEFTTKNIELSLANGMIPHVALKVIDLRVVENDSCLRNTIWRMDEVFFPLRVLPLFKGEFKLGKIAAGTLDISIGNIVSDGACFRPPPSEPLPPLPSVKESKKPRIPQSEGRDKNKSNTAQTLLDLIGGVSVKKLLVRLQDKPEMKLRAADLILTPREEQIVFGGDVTVETESHHELAWPMIHFGGEVGSEMVEIAMNGRWQEGIMNFMIKFERQSPESVSLKGQIKHLPLANFLKIYEQVNKQKVGSYPRSMWLTCDLGLSSKVSEIKNALLNLRECLVEGDIGTWESTSLNYDLNQGIIREPFDIRISHLPMKTLLGVLQMDVLDGVLNQYGQLSGNVSVSAPGDMSFEGFLEDIEVYFSNKGVQAHQGIRKAKVQLSKHEGRISGMFSDLEMRKGQMRGSISLNFDKRFRDGYVQLQINELLLDPSVQELLAKEKLGRIETYGKFKVTDGRFEVFKGDVGIDSMENQTLKLKTFKASISYLGQSLSTQLSAKVLGINTNSEYYDLIKPLLLDKKFSDNFVEMTDLNVNISGYRQYLEWKRGRAQIPVEKAVFSSEGIWQEGAGLSGWISVDFPALKLLRWDVTGDVLSPRLLPSSQWLKELVKEKPRKSR